MKDFESVRNHDNTFVWPEGELIFMCIGKAANSSIKAAVLGTMGGVDPAISVHFDERLRYIPNSTLHEYPAFKAVAVVRDPMNRLISFWRDKIACRDTCNFGHLGLKPGMTFVEMVKIVTELPDSVRDSHVTAQHKLIYHGGGGRSPRIIHYESLENLGWATIQQMAAVHLPNLPHYNKSNPVPVDISARTKKLVDTYYQLDRSIFGYG